MIETPAVKKVIATLQKHGTAVDVLYARMYFEEVEDAFNALILQKEAADASDVQEADIQAKKLQSNPLSGMVVQFATKQPPQNLPQLVDGMAKVLQKDLDSFLQSGAAVTDPLIAENRRLKVMAENLALKNQIEKEQMAKQQEQMAMMGGGAGAPGPEAIAGLAQMMGGQGGAPAEGQGNGLEGLAQVMGEQGGAPAEGTPQQ